MTEATAPDDQPAPDDAEPQSDARSEDSPVRRRRHWWGFGLIAVGIGLLLSCAWVGWQTYQSYRHLDAARHQIGQLKSTLGDLTLNDLDQDRLADLEGALENLRAETRGAVDASNDPLVRLAGHLPLIGPNLSAVSDLSLSADDLADRVLPAVLDAGQQLSSAGFSPKDGRIDPAPVADAAATLTAASRDLAVIDERLAGVDSTVVVKPVADALQQFRAQLVDVQEAVDGGARTGRIVSNLLGGNGDRQFLLVFQNLAEPRATGGIPGSYALLTVEDGRPTLNGQGSASRDLGTFDPPLTEPANVVLPTELYHGLPLRYPMDTTMTPDFPTAAQLLATMYRQHTGVSVDGVISVDPVVLQSFLTGVEPIDVPGRAPVETDDLARYLMSTVYADYAESDDPRARDATLALVTASAFDALLQQEADVLVDGVRAGVADRRILAWSTDADAQADLIGAGVAGDFSAPSGFGVFRNDGTGGKVGYWTDGSVRLVLGTCTQDRRSFTLSVDLAYTPPDGPLPAYVTGIAPAGIGVLRTNLMVFAPEGAELDPILLDGAAVPAVLTLQGNLPVTMITLDQQPGNTSTVVLTGTIPAAAVPAEPVVTVTPGVTNWPVVVQPGQDCS